MNRRALLICYYFPPLGLGGVTRPLNLFKLLPQFGYNCDVLTVKPVLYRAYEPELLRGLDVSHIYRSGSHDIQRLLYLMGIRSVKQGTVKAGSLAISQAFPDSKSGWVGPAVRLGRRLLRDRKYDVIISTSPPISTHLVAMDLAAQSGIRWVADFRDFWHSFRAEEVLISSGKIRKARELLTSIVRQATAITAVNQSIVDYIGAGEVITNGFSTESAMLWRPPSEAHRPAIGLLGTFNDDLPVEPLFRVLASARERAGAEFTSLRVIQVGNVDNEWLTRQLEKFGLVDQCVMHGLQPRDKTISLLNETSLFYIGLNQEHGSGILPGRMFDLLASGRRILAYVPPESEIAQLVSKFEIGTCFTDSNTLQAVNYVVEFIRKAKRGESGITPLPEYSQPYSWGNIARQYAEFLDRVL